ncbi:Transmembrane secretion effector [Gaiella occulta]|uniref:Transmembrane secretion effector n=1 Tax=Gaiella occulta TaxID=1002870 RepID=A0A7M2YZ27_9ACTN|nr:MFS transporter [Gaiella occulta]RDI75014.1 Transmembrane secretion effector [Gaiella occulta]
MGVPLRVRLGPLQERDFRLLFAGTTITTIGDRLASIALAFAVLDAGSVTDLGVVLGVRQAVEAVVLIFGGVLSDRMPRNLVLVGASLLQGAAQAATAAVVLTGGSSLAWLVALQAVYGVGAGMVVPAEVGLVPQTVSAPRLQEANAMQGMSRNLVGVLGPASGGVLVALASPGVALGVDAASFVVCAALLARIRVTPRAAALVRTTYLRELRDGWREFRSHSWLWSTVGVFGLSNMFYVGCWAVLGPEIANRELGGAGAWALILSAGGVGAVLGGVVALRYRPARPLLASVLAPMPMTLPLVGLALGWPPWLIAAVNVASGVGLSVHMTLWFTVFQREIPEHAQSRVSSYDALGSFVLIPLGMAFVGPVAVVAGVDATLWLAVAVFVVATAVIASVPSVRAMRAPQAAVAAAA